MCDRIKVLANCDRYRWVGICEHGTIHLSWDHVMLFFYPCDLQKLAFVLDTAVIEQNHTAQQRRLYYQQTHQASAEQDGYFDLWIDKYAIRLMPVDYLLFGSLICQAITQLPETMIKKVSTTPISIEAKTDLGKKTTPPLRERFSVN